MLTLCLRLHRSRSSLGLGRVRQGAKMRITPVARGCLIKQRRLPILAGNCRIGLPHWGEETIPLWNCAVDEGMFEVISSGWKYPHLVLVLSSGARITLLQGWRYKRYDYHCVMKHLSNLHHQMCCVSFAVPSINMEVHKEGHFKLCHVYMIGMGIYRFLFADAGIKHMYDQFGILAYSANYGQYKSRRCLPQVNDK